MIIYDVWRGREEVGVILRIHCKEANVEKRGRESWGQALGRLRWTHVRGGSTRSGGSRTDTYAPLTHTHSVV